MRMSADGSTVGITLRLPASVYDACSAISSRANMIDLSNGRPAVTTPQDVIRHRLMSDEGWLNLTPQVVYDFVLRDGQGGPRVRVDIRIAVSVMSRCKTLAHAANELAHGDGEPKVTAQDVMRCCLGSIPGAEAVKGG